MSLMRRHLDNYNVLDKSQRVRMANGAESFLFMVKHIDQITNPNHPAKKYRDNAK